MAQIAKKFRSSAHFKLNTPVAHVRARLQPLASPTDVKLSQLNFKTAPGAYGAGDQFIGIRVPVLRRPAREFRSLPLREVTALLHSPIHEERLLALMPRTLLRYAIEKLSQRERRLYLQAGKR
jgi:hypothetical protein